LKAIFRGLFWVFCFSNFQPIKISLNLTFE
jgi:hypothetical protein